MGGVEVNNNNQTKQILEYAHSALPFRVGKCGGSVVTNATASKFGGAEHVDYYGGELVAESVCPSDQKFIVTACNNFWDMFKALELIATQKIEHDEKGQAFIRIDCRSVFDLGAIIHQIVREVRPQATELMRPVTKPEGQS